MTFNSRPHMEVDRDGNPVYAAIRALSTHDLTWRSTSCTRYDLPRRSTFQLTTSHGGRHLRGLLWSGMLAFQLTTSHGGRRHHTATAFSQFGLSTHDLTWRSTLPAAPPTTGDRTFNSRPHMEVDSALISPLRMPVSFNSRPHMEVDRSTKNKSNRRILSTHDLTWRSTA